MNTNISVNLEVNLEVNEDGTLNVWIARESSTGLHYYNVTPKKIGELVENEIEDIVNYPHLTTSAFEVGA